MLRDPSVKYRPFPTIDIPDRTWPSKVIATAPRWLSTDMRDGNQALIDPMDAEKKNRFFDLLVKIGLKEIEVGFPAAGATEFDFISSLIAGNRIPDDVTIQVLTQSRRDLIETSFQSLKGAKQAIVHLYNAVSPAWRKIVFGMSRDEIRQIAIDGAKVLRDEAAKQPDTKWSFEYSPETFSTAELDFSVEVCAAVMDILRPTPENPLILNLPATVECATPNVYADQIEWFGRNIPNRDSVVISLHTHNDRGTGVAAAELGLMAGADRVEGCLLGNGERTGNCDLVTVALNMYTQGVDPKLDLSDIDEVVKTVEYATNITVHPRTPYAGDLVFTAFSGSHQDAIKKGFAAQAARNDGVAWVLEQDKGLKLPKRMQADFSRIVQALADETSRELNAADIWGAFERTYLPAANDRFVLRDYEETGAAGDRRFVGRVAIDGEERSLSGRGNGLISSVIAALAETTGPALEVVDYSEHAIGHGADAQAATYLECRTADGRTVWGVGIDSDIATASVRAVLSAANRA
ncbi:MAG: 2-isopropylmalate synthase [Sphingomonas sp. 66-10]|uniref:2-isopropylmalate synthase n=1 Tax=Sphingomonas sp. 66-10 TaxID=1895848 RepID=UPI000926D809|nr:2-isopropylmalate synthase [Sphingomonas sp. 66-10]OJU19351.1 MAG: 2-isopropylmalate synthase [Sphingomonas sp. 66-10]